MESTYPREFTMASSPRNGSVIKALKDNKWIAVYWVKGSQFGRDGGAYTDGKQFYKPIEFAAWKP